MKRTTLRIRKIPVAPTDAGNAAPWSDFVDSFDDRISESLVDYEDEREAMEVVVPRTGSVH